MVAKKDFYPMSRFKENMIRQLTRHEGLRLKPYRCPAGKLTIGIGRNPDRHDGIGTRDVIETLGENLGRLLANDADTFGPARMREFLDFSTNWDPAATAWCRWTTLMSKAASRHRNS